MVRKHEMTMTKEAQKFYAALGQCISIWSHIEDRVFLICNLAIGSDESIAAIVFFRTNSLSGRITLTDEIVQQRLQPTPLKTGQHPPKLLKDWNKLHGKLTQHIKFRNFIAHQPDRVDIETLWAIARARGATVAEFDRLYDESTLIQQHRADKDRRPMSLTKVGLGEMADHLQTMNAIYERLNEFSLEFHGYMRSLE